MKNKKFDQELKSELEDYQSSVDPAAIWAAIGEEVEQINEAKEDNKKPLVWIFSLLFIGLLLGLAIGWNINTKPSKKTFGNDFDNKGQVEKIADSKDKVWLVNSNVQNLNISEKKNERIKTPKSVIVTSFSINKKTKQPILFIPPIQNYNTFGKEQTTISEQDSYAIKDVSNISNKVNKLDIKENVQLFLKEKSNIKKQFLTPISMLKSEHLIDDRSNPLASIVAPEIIPTPSFADRPRRRTRTWNLGVEIQGGASLTNREFSLVNNESATYLSLREATESTLETIQLGGKLELQHRTGFSISTGIQWSQITEKYTIEEKTTEDKLENTLISYSIDMNQDTVNRTYDDILRTRTTTTTREGFNRYRLLDIPLLVGYHFKNENWSIGLETGILANLNLSTKGFVYDENSQLIDLNANQKNVFKPSIGMGFYFGATGRIALTDHMQVTINPFYRINGGSFSVTENPIAQKYTWIGMNVGLRYGF